MLKTQGSQRQCVAEKVTSQWVQKMVTIDPSPTVTNVQWISSTGVGQVSLSKKTKKILRRDLGLRPNLTWQQRLGIKIFLDRISVLDFHLNQTCQEKC